MGRQISQALTSAENGGAHVESHTSLHEFREALARLRSQINGVAVSARTKWTARIAAVDAACDARREAMEDARRDLRNADDDEYDYYADLLEEARDEFRKAKEAVRQAHNASAHAHIAFRRLEHVGIELLGSAESDLKQRLADLAGSARTQLERHTAPCSTRPIPANVAQAQTQAMEPQEVLSAPLPPRFIWVPIAAIPDSELEAIRSADDFKKYSAEDIDSSLRTVRDVILPQFSDPLKRSSSHWGEADSLAGKAYEKGVQRAYDALFSSKGSIYLERKKGEDTYRVIDGRHRIWVARRAGWTSVPAQVKDLGDE